MNIFVLYQNPRVAAEMHCDKHVSSTFRVNSEPEVVLKASQWVLENK